MGSKPCGKLLELGTLVSNDFPLYRGTKYCEKPRVVGLRACKEHLQPAAREAGPVRGKRSRT